MYYDTPDYVAYHEKLSGAAVRRKLPGIFSAPMRVLEGRPEMADANPEKILKPEITK